jgi:hypothetical protein
MTDKKVTDLTALTGANTASDDVLLITDVSASTSNKITLAEMNNAIVKYAITFTDSLFSLADNTTSSKKAQFQLSGISSATTRTFTLPDTDATLAHIGSAAQTFAGDATFSGAVNITDSLLTISDNSTPSKKAKFELSSLTSATTRTYTLPDISATLAHLGSASQTFAGTVTLTNGLAAASGGTGNQSYTIGDILYASGTTALSKLAGVATGNALISGGVGTAPSYGKIGLTTHVSGTLPIANGGTNATTAINALSNLTTYTTTATAAGTTTLTNSSTYYQYFTGTSTQTVVLPATSTLSLGWSFHICNNSTGNVSVQASDNSAVITILAGTTAHITCTSTSVTTSAAWESGLTDFSTNTGTGSNVLATSPTITTPTLSGIQVSAGTNTVAPLKLTSGTNLTSAAAGAIEYDGSVYYQTGTTTLGRGYTPVTQHFKLTSDGSAIGPTIANFFGSSSGVALETSAYYELEAELFFTKTTAGTVTFTLTFSNAPISASAYYVGTPVGGVGTVGTSQTAAVIKSTSTATATPATGSLTTAVNHQYKISAIFQANATTAGSLNLQITSSAGTVTPLTLSNYKIRRIATANVGTFA